MTDDAVLKRLFDRMNTALGQGDWRTLEDAWLEALKTPTGDAAPAFKIVERVIARGERALAGDLLLLWAPELRAAGRWDELLAACRLAAPLAPADRDLPALYRAAAAAVYAARPDVAACLARADLEREGRFAEGAALLERLLSWQPGDCVRHEGWGVGFVTAIEAADERLVIDFPQKAGHRIALALAERVLQRLPADGFEARARRDRAGLAAEPPIELVRRLLADRGRPADQGKSLSTRDLKAALDAFGLPDGGWTSWWKAARRALGSDPWFELGRGANAAVTLRDRPQTLADEVRARFAKVLIFEDALRIAREVLAQVREAGEDVARLEFLREYFLARRDHGPGAAPVEYLESVLLIESAFGIEVATAPVAPAALLAGPDVRAVLAAMADDAGRCRLAELVRAAGPDWPARWADWFGLGDETFWDFLVDGLAAGGEEARVRAHVAAVAAESARRPREYLWWARAYFAGDPHRADPATPAPAVFGRLFQNLTAADRRRKRDKQDREAWAVYEGTRHMLGDRRGALIGDFVAAARAAGRADDLETLDVLIAHCPALSETMVANFRRFLPRLRPAEQPAGLVETATFACTSGALTRKQEELRVLTEDLLPEAEEAIGRAQAMGDLSENAEWEAAIERRAQLARHQQELERLITLAEPIDFDHVEHDRVTVGTRVRLAQPENGEEVVFTVYGPFEADHVRNILSHKSPLARQLIGRRPGETFTVETPGGAATWTVRAIEVARPARAAEPVEGTGAVEG